MPVTGWSLRQIMAAYRVDDRADFQRWLRGNGVSLPIADRQTVKNLVGAYRKAGGR